MFDSLQELCRRSTVQYLMIAGKTKVHHRTNDHLTVFRNHSVGDATHRQNTGFGVAITTNDSRRQSMNEAGITYVPVLDAFAKRSIAIVWNPKHYLSRAAVDFRDFVMDTEL